MSTFKETETVKCSSLQQKLATENISGAGSSEVFFTYYARKYYVLSAASSRKPSLQHLFLDKNTVVSTWKANITIIVCEQFTVFITREVVLSSCHNAHSEDEMSFCLFKANTLRPSQYSYARYFYSLSLQTIAPQAPL